VIEAILKHRRSSLNEARSFEQVLADLLAEYERNPRPELARTIAMLRAEIELKKHPD